MACGGRAGNGGGSWVVAGLAGAGASWLGARPNQLRRCVTPPSRALGYSAIGPGGICGLHIWTADESVLRSAQLASRRMLLPPKVCIVSRDNVLRPLRYVRVLLVRT